MVPMEGFPTCNDRLPRNKPRECCRRLHRGRQGQILGRDGQARGTAAKISQDGPTGNLPHRAGKEKPRDEVHQSAMVEVRKCGSSRPRSIQRPASRQLCDCVWRVGTANTHATTTSGGGKGPRYRTQHHTSETEDVTTTDAIIQKRQDSDLSNAISMATYQNAKRDLGFKGKREGNGSRYRYRLQIQLVLQDRGSGYCDNDRAEEDSEDASWTTHADPSASFSNKSSFESHHNGLSQSHRIFLSSP